MKKLVFIAIFVLAFASISAAEVDVEFGGDARIRSFYNDGTGVLGGPIKKYWDQRFRVFMHAIVSENAEVRVMLKPSEGTWDGTQKTQETERMLDYAYLFLQQDGYEAHLGTQYANWGNRFFVWESPKDRIKLLKKFDNITVGVIHDTLYEGSVEVDDDATATLGFVEGEFDTFSGGILAGQFNNSLNDTSGQFMDLYLRGVAGQFTFAGEVASRSGEYSENIYGETPLGYFGSVGMFFDQVTFSLTGAYAEGGYIAENDFTPSLLLGTKQPTAVMNFGEAAAASGMEGDSSTMIGLSYDQKMSDKLAIGAKLGQAELSKKQGVTVNEVDVYFSYDLFDNVNLFAGYGYGTIEGVPDFIAETDTLNVAGFKIEVIF